MDGRFALVEAAFGDNLEGQLGLPQFGSDFFCTGGDPALFFQELRQLLRGQRRRWGNKAGMARSWSRAIEQLGGEILKSTATRWIVIVVVFVRIKTYSFLCVGYKQGEEERISQLGHNTRAHQNRGGVALSMDLGHNAVHFGDSEGRSA